MSDTPTAPTTLDPHVLRYLEHVRVEKRLAARTLTLYALDLEKLAQFAAAVSVPLLQLQTAHVRRFVAQMHSGGRSGRGIALILSGWRGFFIWAGRQGLIPHNPVQDVRAPKAPKPLPKALGVDDAVRRRRRCAARHRTVRRPARQAAHGAVDLAAPAPAQPAGGADHARAPAHAAPLVCQPPAAKQRRPARRAGAAGARQHHDHAGLYAAGFSAPGQGV